MNDERLRALLHDAVADVEPTRDLDLSEAPTRRPAHWLPVTVAAALATVLVVTGTTWLVQRGGETPPVAAPGSPTASRQVAPAGSTWVPAYAVVETPAGPRLTTDRRTVTASLSRDETAGEAVVQTLRGEPVDPDVTSFLPPGSRVEADVTIGDDRVDVLLTGSTGALADLPEDRLALLPDALARSVADALDDPEVTVAVAAEGPGAAVLPPDGPSIDLSGGDEVLAPVVVDDLGEGQVLPTRFTVVGRALAFEGTVVWRLRDSFGEVQREGFTTAGPCCGTTPFSFEVEALRGVYILEVAETDPSDGEGFPAYVDTTSIEVQ